MPQHTPIYLTSWHKLIRNSYLWGFPIILVMKRIDFLRESLKNIKSVGTVTRSSKFACKAMIAPVDFSEANVIVELGAGDGVITEHIIKNMKSDAILLSFEVNPKFCKKIRELDDPRLHVIEDSAEHLGKYLQKHNLKEANYVISAIPFVSLPDELGYAIVGECKKYLKEGGLFVQIHYSLLAKKIYEKIFGNVDINFEPLNIPPAFVLVSQKRSA